MLSFNTFFLPVVLLLMLAALSLTTLARPSSLYHVCENSTFSQNSLYNSSLKSLLSSLSSNVTRNIEFYNTTSGQNTSDILYGLFLCRGDVSSQKCQACVATATKELATKCSKEKIAVIWYDECMIHYSNESIFSTVAVRPRISLLNTQNITEQDRFNRLVNTTMTDLASRASNFPIGAKKFGTNATKFSEFQNLYNLVQCTPDLSSTDCYQCLQTAINRLPICCNGKQGGRVLFPSCNVRYELYPFYEGASPAPPPTQGPPSPPPPTGSASGSKGKSKISTTTTVAIVAPIAVAVLLFIVGCCFLIRRGRNKLDAGKGDNALNDITTVESLQFDFSTIEAATNKFSENSKLGEGGFGVVYKGTLSNGQEIAVKRLSKRSGQGAEQFKNEVVLVAKLQHRNLARLLGFCMAGEERILVYEFIPNKSLDNFLYDPERQRQLDWSKRYKIIDGIARGIQYLHEDSRLKIIHRDLKVSNILLDANMNPKISDFGMARIFGVDQTQGNTSRVVGTYGYMSPEYAMHGEFSVKSDVYSFGVLILEIISGKKNSTFYESDGAEDLLSYAWIHWRDGTPMELLDPVLGDSYSRDEVMRCIHIGLLCVQEDPADRPSMASIVLTLSSHSVTLQAPQQPAFFLRSKTDMPTRVLESGQSTSASIPLSVNEASITELHPR
ncbi:LOW QUALITY PROTEIN: cysteine-rich receptor-like protein kinase 10 [Juglans microcarpa x Juglans regia]|uniref:LOW QUALITY PROTEIN: cysteine-rich receptor-like protein kinase 10 n=1 Tax=Juglans microcarpa x Juglans regia TaxID=2249226 RepID=UPI001B7E5B82|nr:LOW QUALITY PROTEIN: cysteine-rich receptor-like protein kinase 10 [Juglans microcarpa x Juglans regia]